MGRRVLTYMCNALQKLIQGTFLHIGYQGHIQGVAAGQQNAESREAGFLKVWLAALSLQNTGHLRWRMHRKRKGTGPPKSVAD